MLPLCQIVFGNNQHLDFYLLVFIWINHLILYLVSRIFIRVLAVWISYTFGTHFLLFSFIFNTLGALNDFFIYCLLPNLFSRKILYFLISFVVFRLFTQILLYLFFYSIVFVVLNIINFMGLLPFRRTFYISHLVAVSWNFNFRMQLLFRFIVMFTDILSHFYFYLIYLFCIVLRLFYLKLNNYILIYRYCNRIYYLVGLLENVFWI